jgi:hypothetical protein
MGTSTTTSVGPSDVWKWSVVSVNVGEAISLAVTGAAVVDAEDGTGVPDVTGAGEAAGAARLRASSFLAQAGSARRRLTASHRISHALGS